MGKRVLGVAVLLLAVAMAGTAAADMVVLQQGAGYNGAKDVYFSQTPSSAAGANQHGDYSATGMWSMFYSSEGYMGLMQFDLNGVPASSVISATLKLYNNSANLNPVKAQQVGQSWDEGTGDGNYWKLVDGATHRCRYAPRSVDNDAGLSWVADGASYQLSATVELAPDPRAPSDPLRYHVRRGRAAEAGYLRGYENYYGLGTAYADKASLDAATVTGYAYYYDGANDLLYMRQADGNAPQYINFVDTDNYWDYTSRLAAGYWQGQTDAVANDWLTMDVTEVVQRWMGLDGYALEANCGLQLNSVNNTTGSYIFSSDYDDDPSLRPMLIIEFVGPVPEPAGLGLMGLALLGLKKRRSY